MGCSVRRMRCVWCLVWGGSVCSITCIGIIGIGIGKSNASRAFLLLLHNLLGRRHARHVYQHLLRIDHHAVVEHVDKHLLLQIVRMTRFDHETRLGHYLDTQRGVEREVGGAGLHVAVDHTLWVPQGLEHYLTPVSEVVQTDAH